MQRQSPRRYSVRAQARNLALPERMHRMPDPDDEVSDREDPVRNQKDLELIPAVPDPEQGPGLPRGGTDRCPQGPSRCPTMLSTAARQSLARLRARGTALSGTGLDGTAALSYARLAALLRRRGSLDTQTGRTGTAAGGRCAGMRRTGTGTRRTGVSGGRTAAGTGSFAGWGSRHLRTENGAGWARASLPISAHPNEWADGHRRRLAVARTWVQRPFPRSPRAQGKGSSSNESPSSASASKAAWSRTLT